ncbi:hypothetical protein [Trichormus variabilis]|uniref:YtkA-like domain-containing protein n=1 Tax=Trichormus variabilis SAG 1403-4b TaxID=447716 RepID=A0A433UWN5_ANAVA|nr:hypothetical protein [Trichormus variabilis]MBD2626130.1 hypothetical protein [Trichormus variabilis FACHB-164]RUS98253.1 hypothetical protein DSM107003_13410 [Trichormus variabilis SAG 1403-4b]
MKQFLTSIFMLTTLLIAPSCSSENQSSEVKVSPSMKMNNEKDSMSEHEGHSMEHINQENNSKTTTKAKLIAPKNLVPNQPINLVIDIQDSAGKPVTKFDNFQEKLMHLIVVSNDLRFFEHIHPEYQENGSFKVSPKFPESGEYTIFSDYKPAEQKETVSLMNISIPGSVPLPKSLEKFQKSQTISNTKINLDISEKNIKPGKDITLKFDLKDSKNQPIKDLQPYLGEKGHLVIIKSSSPLTAADYIHAHALKNTTDGAIEFKTKLPQKGTYKMWMQFNRNGKVNTADFWVNAE